MGCCCSHPDPTLYQETDSTPSRLIRGSSNTATFGLTITPALKDQPPLRLRGSSNKIAIALETITCALGQDCKRRLEADLPLAIVGHSNTYDVNLRCFGKAPEVLVGVNGNANVVEVVSRRERVCDCVGNAVARGQEDVLTGRGVEDEGEREEERVADGNRGVERDGGPFVDVDEAITPVRHSLVSVATIPPGELAQGLPPSYESSWREKA